GVGSDVQSRNNAVSDSIICCGVSFVFFGAIFVIGAVISVVALCKQSSKNKETVNICIFLFSRTHNVSSGSVLLAYGKYFVNVPCSFFLKRNCTAPCSSVLNIFTFASSSVSKTSFAG